MCVIFTTVYVCGGQKNPQVSVLFFNMWVLQGTWNIPCLRSPSRRMLRHAAVTIWSTDDSEQMLSVTIPSRDPSVIFNLWFHSGRETATSRFQKYYYLRWFDWSEWGDRLSGLSQEMVPLSLCDSSGGAEDALGTITHHIPNRVLDLSLLCPFSAFSWLIALLYPETPQLGARKKPSDWKNGKRRVKFTQHLHNRKTWAIPLTSLHLRVLSHKNYHITIITPMYRSFRAQCCFQMVSAWPRDSFNCSVLSGLARSELSAPPQLPCHYPSLSRLLEVTPYKSSFPSHGRLFPAPL